jgi:NADPH:quinone reductase-like Zn-dependent oxidoreductase
MGIQKPRKPVLGMDLAGEIEAVGRNVKKFKNGDKVFASAGFKFGTYAEYICLPETGIIVIKPPKLSFEETAPVVNGGIMALCLLKKADIQPGQKVLIYGASGSVGTYALQLAKYFKAEVTGVCSTSNLKMVKGLGAFEVIDYTKEDLTKRNIKYDVIFDAVGKLNTKAAKQNLTKNGTYLNVLKTSPKGAKDIKNLIFLRELMEKGELKTIIDKTYTLDNIVEAHRYVDKEHKKGNVVITVYDNNK